MNEKTNTARSPNLDQYVKRSKVKRYVTYYEGARLYNMQLSVFMRTAKTAEATYPIRKTAMVDLDKLEKYLNEQASYKKQQEIDQEEAAEMVRKEIENLQELVEAGTKKFIRIDEGSKLYSMGRTTFRKLADDAGAIYQIGATLLVNVPELEAYIATQSLKKKKKEEVQKSFSKRRKGK